MIPRMMMTTTWTLALLHQASLIPLLPPIQFGLFHLRRTARRVLRKRSNEEKKFRSHPELLLKRENWAFTRELRECDVGILGAGDVARETALLLEGFGATVRVCSRNQPSVAIRGAQWYAATELRDFYKNLDALVIACPLTQLTKSSVGMSQFALMRNGIIVNSARAESPEVVQW